MRTIDLKYGRGTIVFEYNESNFEVLDQVAAAKPLSDAEIAERFDSPIDSPTIEQIVSPNERVLLVVPDATRQTGAGQIVNLLVRRLIANGSKPTDLNISFATG